MLGVSTQLTEAPLEVEEPDLEDVPHDERPWVVIVWNDPINLMSYVTYVLQKLFGYSRARATRLMLQVHNEGKAVVSSGTREKAELDVSRLHAHGLWATMQQD
jgi:ATP-dependent Clp protease adaptor protein ClpS